MHVRYFQLRFFHLVFLLLFLFLPIFQLSAQWVEEEIDIQKGWNPIHVTVNPPASCDQIFTNSPVAGVYKWNKHFTTAQFSSSSESLENKTDEWLHWLPPRLLQERVNTLNYLQAGATYLVNATNSFSFTIKGTPGVPSRDWVPESYNLVGFPVDGNGSFADYLEDVEFVDTEGHAVKLTHTNMNAVSISGPAGGGTLQKRKIERNTAYWIYADSPGSFCSPIDVGHTDAGILDFSDEYYQRGIQIANNSSRTTTVQVTHIRSKSAPAGMSAVIGPVPLSSYSAEDDEWREMDIGGSVQRQLLPGENWNLDLTINRKKLDAGTSDNVWQSVLKVESGTDLGVLRHVGVTAMQSSYGSVWGQNADWPEGLWVGEALIDKVSYFKDNSSTTNASKTVPTPHAFPVRLIVHCRTNQPNNVKLMQQTIMSWQKDSQSTNGHYVIYAGQESARADPEFDPASAYRVSSVALGMFGTAANESERNFGDQVSFEIGCGATDPGNPFYHRYNPQHDNMNWDWQAITNRNYAESWGFTNRVVLSWSTNGCPWNAEQQTSGVYTQVLSGFRKRDIYMSGRFQLRRVLDVEKLHESSE